MTNFDTPTAPGARARLMYDAVVAAIATAVTLLRTPVSAEAEERAEAVALTAEEPAMPLQRQAA